MSEIVSKPCRIETVRAGSYIPGGLAGMISLTVERREPRKVAIESVAGYQKILTYTCPECGAVSPIQILSEDDVVELYELAKGISHDELTDVIELRYLAHVLNCHQCGYVDEECLPLTM